MLLDFKEIPKATANDGQQDVFELFARDFFEELGFKIISGPNRGADNGMDLLIEENRRGILDNTKFRWLVSCKHKAHSGTSVRPVDEQDISDRLKSNNADGFIGFYSTLPSGGLQAKFKENQIEYKLFDHKHIEKVIIENNLQNLMRRYFPKSFSEYENDQYRISNLLDEYSPLKCDACKKDLLDKSVQKYNIIVFWGEYKEEDSKEIIKDISFVCKGSCDNEIKNKQKKLGLSDLGWEDISDIIIPTKFIEWVCAILNDIYYGETIYSEKAFEKLKHFIICVSQLVCRNTTEENKERIKLLNQILF